MTLQRIITQFRADISASIALESAAIIPLLLILSWGIFEYCIIMFGNAVMDHVIEDFAARARLGCTEVSSIASGKPTCVDPQDLTIGAIRRDVQRMSLNLISACNEKSHAKFAVSISPIASAPLIMDEFTSDKVDFGKESNLIVYSLHYHRRVFFPLFIMPSFNHMAHYTATTVVRNAEFGDSSLFRLPSSADDTSC